MTLELLRSFAAARLPVVIRDNAVIDQIRILRAAGCLAAMTSSPGSPTPFASVLCITAKGRSLLSRGAPEPDHTAAGPTTPAQPAMETAATSSAEDKLHVLPLDGEVFTDEHPSTVPEPVLHR